MSSLATLGKVIEIATRRRDEALAAHAALQRDLAAAQAQMDQLRSYADESLARWSQRGQQGVDAALLMHHRQFMAKLDHAIEFQTAVLREKQTRLDEAHARVITAERELAGLSKYVERQQHALAQRENRLDQKRNDEMALNLHRLAQAQASTAGWTP